MTRRPQLLLAAILLTLPLGAFLLRCWAGMRPDRAQASVPVGQTLTPTPSDAAPTAASRDLARPVLPASPDPAADQPAARAQTSPSAHATALTGARSVATQGPAVVVGKASAAGPSAYEKLRAAISWCESRNQPTVINKTSGAAGLFQFMPQTFRAVTGLKPPASAYSVAIQTAAFDALYAAQGTAPWRASEWCWGR